MAMPKREASADSAEAPHRLRSLLGRAGGRSIRVPTHKRYPEKATLLSDAPGFHVEDKWRTSSTSLSATGR